MAFLQGRLLEMFSKFVNHVAAGLITFLMMHPDIRRKEGLSEPHFFNRDDVHERREGVPEFHALFRTWKNYN